MNINWNHQISELYASTQAFGYDSRRPDVDFHSLFILLGIMAGIIIVALVGNYLWKYFQK